MTSMISPIFGQWNHLVMHDVIVIGGGLTGLIAFRHLAAELDVLLLEARPRVLASAGVSCF